MSRIFQIEEIEETHLIQNDFVNERILTITDVPWFADYANYLVGGLILDDFDYNKRKKFLYDCRLYTCNDPFLNKNGINGLI